MRFGIFLILGLMSLNAAGFASNMSTASEAAQLIGRYVNSKYNGKYSYQVAYVEFSQNEQGDLEMKFNIPCDTKLTPRIFRVLATSSIAGDLEVIEHGSSQCYTGKNPTFFLLGPNLVIYTNPRIWVPGFDGSYLLEKDLN